jgi:cytoskeleton protein RodZ
MIFRKSKENGALPGDMTNFGASFKKARESRGVSLDQIAAETRISTRFLVAIENEEFNLLPGGIFNRGFVRSYAEKIGLDPDQAVAEYERLAQVREPAAETTVAPAAQERKSERNLYPVAIGGLLLVILIFYVVTRETSNTAQTASTPPTPPPVASVSAPAATQPAQPAQPPSTPPETSAAAPEPPPAPAPVAEPLRIDMDVKEPTWIKVEVDGNPVNPGELLEPGMTRHFAAQKSIFLTIGNASGLALKINDMPTKNLGKPGQVRELHITPENIKDFTG